MNTNITDITNISEDIKYIGVNDRKTDLFEGQFIVENGMAYNSYVILDEKIAVMDTVEASFGEEWMSNLKTVLNGKTPSYLIVQHMEPDHSANIKRFTEEFPGATIVATAKAFEMIKNFYGTDYADSRMVVKSGDNLNLGKHTLSFIAAPMVHWPEVIVTYDSCDKVLFSADAFGKFGALDADEDWACEARRYYFGIVGKYGMQVQKLLKAASELEINTICPLHGPILTDNIQYNIDLYNTWSSYKTETEGVVIAYTSVYGNTKTAVEKLQSELEKQGCPKVVVTDLIRDDMAEAVEDAFRHGTLVLATTTYNGGIFPKMGEFIRELTEKGYRNRKIAFMENGSWLPNAAKTMRAMFDGLKNIDYAETTVTVNSALNADSTAQIEKLADELAADFK